MIDVRDVTFTYRDVDVLVGVGLRATPGTVLGLIGPNGSGKTTLLRCIHAALAPRSGLVVVDDREVSTMNTREVAQRIAVLAQESSSDLGHSVAEVVLLGRLPKRADHQRFSKQDRMIASDALTRVGARHLAARSFATLSGGERQRVLIARCLAQEVSHLLLDEPTNHLDIRYQHEILTLVRELRLTTVIVLHDLNLAARYCDELVLLDRGTVARAGPVSEVLVPEVLEPVYGISARRHTDGNDIHLSFGPSRTSPLNRV